MTNNRMLDQLDAEIEEMDNAFYGKGEEKKEEVEATSAEEPSTDVEEVTSEDDVETTELEASVEEVTESTPEVNETAEDDKPKRVQWKRKYEKELQDWNKHRATLQTTIHQLRTQQDSYADHITALQEKVETLSNKLLEVSQNTSNIADHFDEADRDILGESAINSLGKVVDVTTKPIREELAEMKRREAERIKNESTNNRTAADLEFRSRLGQIVPTYNEVNENPAFTTFLNDIDPVNGATRMRWFKDAQRSGNVGVVASYFNDFIEMNRAPERILEDKITPMSSGNRQVTESGDTGNKPKIFPYSQVEAFHDAVTSGKFRGTDEQRNQIDKEFDRAYNEGRIDFHS